MDRHRWGPGASPPPDDAVAGQVVSRLRRRRAARIGWPILALLLVTPPMAAQWSEALARFRDGDGAGAARLFEHVALERPAAPSAWFNLGAARWSAGDDIGSAAAWIQGQRVAPRDTRFGQGLDAVTSMPRDLRKLTPTVPLSRDELVMLGLVGWLVCAFAWHRHRQVALVAGSVMVLALGTAGTRTWVERQPQGLVRHGAVLRVSPVPTAPVLAQAEAWSVAALQRAQAGWLLVVLEDGRRGWIPEAQVAAFVPLH
jgi:hypothetical protein